jgi:P-type Ca2+ transporter type 2C
MATSNSTLVAATEVVAALESDANQGLSSAEAAARLARTGPNRILGVAPAPAWRRLLSQFADPLIYLLLVAIVVSVLAWALEGAAGLPIEALVIAIVVVANGCLGFLQERSAERAVAALQEMAAPLANVVRDGRPASIPAADVVPGDILVLAEGDAVAADARLVRSASLSVGESSLTGESEPVLKDPAPLAHPVALGDRLNMVFRGTAVSRGRGRAVVTGTGMETEIGRIATLLAGAKEERTPLQREIALVGRTLGIAVIIIAVVVIAAILARSDIRGPRDLVDVLLLGVSLAVAAVPEGLPAILSVILALGVQRMARRQAIIRKLSSVETLGSASVIGSDKTGTLTRNEMTIQRVLSMSGEVTIEGSGYRPEGAVLADGEPLRDGALLDEIRIILGGGSLANDASLLESAGEWTIQGDPTDAAFLVAQAKLGIAAAWDARFSRRAEVPFTSERKLMSSIEADASRGDRLVIVTKGAPGALLARCTREQVGTETVALVEERRAAILAGVDRLADLALRTLAVAYRRLDATEIAEVDERIEQELVFAGVVGMIDPPRPEAAAAIAEAHAAGIRIIMITGDHPRTAARIAADLGISPNPEAAAVTGLELEDLDGPAFADLVRLTSVFARVAPEQKLRIVEALKADGHIVAMTGDGVNDAPALKAADIGVAMGISGTDVAKEAAKMILVDDNFATIVAAVREGRAILANIRTFLRYLLSSNAGEVLTMFLGVVGASVIGLDVAGEAVVVPLLATQILWINLLTDSTPALALGYEPPPPDVMKLPPRKPTDRLIDGAMWADVVLVGLVMSLATLATLDIVLPGGLIAGSGTLIEARTAAFTVLVLAQLFNCFNARSDRVSAFRGFFTNPRLFAAIGLSLALQVLVVHLPLLNTAFGTVPLSGGDWLLCIAMASTVLWVGELWKAVFRRSARRGAPSRPTGPDRAGRGDDATS